MEKTGWRRPKNKGKSAEERWCYLMLAIPIIGFLVFNVYPIIWSFKWSFYSYTDAESSAVFVGLRNFITVFHDKTYWNALLTTAEFTLIKVPLEMCLACILAMILTKRMKGSSAFRAIYYMPNVVSVAVIGVIFTNMFGYFGVINDLLQKIGVISKGIDWFSTKWSALWMLALVSIWNTFGVNVMYFLSALANVPEELYESASLDGANGWNKFIHITLPCIRPVLGVVILLALLGTLSTNEYILALTGGAPNGTTHTVMSYLTQQYVPGFAPEGDVQLGYGSAMSLVTTIIFAVVGILQQKISNGSKEKS